MYAASPFTIGTKKLNIYSKIFPFIIESAEGEILIKVTIQLARTVGKIPKKIYINGDIKNIANKIGSYCPNKIEPKINGK